LKDDSISLFDPWFILGGKCVGTIQS